ncbi:molybdenum cofactor biosynthesis protein MoaE [Aeromicrobium sp. CnD17-E]|uniref:molybdenum cofactor biosynthesis protein MoaE n=1 Tax=Aeromicrobium sp. CnD17-E TaxID=2954487 RepID=UPI00209855BA|nr:molybdenum cofactor biosynthesis protein MoaE [Aeromicrobium sp. CnD17-E]MCO7237800.1 molybdenum cofactor biosynthesis protein MoaE [Aeromicrobium sp. CnD17-E]
MTLSASRPDFAARQTAHTWTLVATTLPDSAAAESWAGRPETGAVVTFRGLVRDHAPGHTGVTAIDYEAYDQVAHERLSQLAELVRATWSDVSTVALWHRTGVVRLGEASVQVTVGAGHRDAAFDAARFGIDVLKACLPVWKREHAAEGLEWSASGVAATSVEEAASAWLSRHGVGAATAGATDGAGS